MTKKYCGKCNKYKSLKQFNNHCETKDGKQTRCRECQNKNDLKRYYALKDNMYGKEII